MKWNEIEFLILYQVMVVGEQISIYVVLICRNTYLYTYIFVFIMILCYRQEFFCCCCCSYLFIFLPSKVINFHAYISFHFIFYLVQFNFEWNKWQCFTICFCVLLYCLVLYKAPMRIFLFVFSLLCFCGGNARVTVNYILLA